MTPPADLAALRALVEAVAQFREAEADLWRHQRRCRDCETSRASSPCGATYQQNLMALAKQVLFAALPAAQTALERVAIIEGCEVCGHRKGALQTGPRNPWQIKLDGAEARIARLEGIHHEVVKRIRDEADPDAGRPWLVDQVLTILEGQPTQGDLEWQRVHGPVIQGDAAVTSEASAQAARDVAHWRKRAEAAEARAVREGRDE